MFVPIRNFCPDKKILSRSENSVSIRKLENLHADRTTVRFLAMTEAEGEVGFP